ALNASWLGRLRGPAIVTPFTTTSSPGFVSSQFPPVSAARSTMTEPGRIASTISLRTRRGALRPGIAAVVTMTSASATAFATTACTFRVDLQFQELRPEAADLLARRPAHIVSLDDRTHPVRRGVLY